LNDYEPYQNISYVVSPTQNGPTFKVQAQ